MRVIIDGENMRHQIAHVLHFHGKLTDKNAYFSYDLMNFLRDILHDEDIQASYYTTRIKQPRTKVPVKLAKQVAMIGEANRRWIADLTNQGVEVVKAGYLRVRESNACIHCGKKTLVLQEKGVDVRVATDLVLSKEHAKQIVLASSDSDLTPAMEVTKKSGVYIHYLCYSGWLNRSVAAQAHKTVTFDDIDVLKYYRGK